jgi:hypothetical protein
MATEDDDTDKPNEVQTPSGSIGERRPLEKAEPVGAWGVNSYHVVTAFEALTGINPLSAEGLARPDVQNAFAVVNAAIVAVMNPHDAKTRWLRETADALDWKQGEVFALLGRIARDLAPDEEPGPVRTALVVNVSPEFRNLTDEHIRRAQRMVGEQKGGATNHGEWSVAATLAISCEALGCRRNLGESEHNALLREANRLRTAAKRATHTP